MTEIFYQGTQGGKLYILTKAKDHRGNHLILKILVQIPPSREWVLERQIRLEMIKK